MPGMRRRQFGCSSVVPAGSAAPPGPARPPTAAGTAHRPSRQCGANAASTKSATRPGDPAGGAGQGDRVPERSAVGPRSASEFAGSVSPQHAVLLAQRDVGTLPPAGERWQVMRRGHRHRATPGLVRGPARGRREPVPLALKPQHTHPVHAMRIQRRAESLGNRAEILRPPPPPDADAIRAPAGAACPLACSSNTPRRQPCPLGHHPKPLQSHRVVDPHAAGIAQARAASPGMARTPHCGARAARTR